MDPMRAISTRTWLTRAAAALAALAIAAWAYYPLAPAAVERPDLAPDTVEPSDDESHETWSAAAFAATIWHTPPKPEAPTEPEPAQTIARREPLKLQLIAIVTSDDGTRLAALYDPDSDALHLVAGGEPIGGFTVEEIEPPRVVLARGRDRHTMTLEREGG